MGSPSDGFAPTPEEAAAWQRETATDRDDREQRLHAAIRESAKHAEKAMSSPYYKPIARGATPQPTKKRQAPEGDVQREILAYLATKNIWAWRTNRSGMPIRDKNGYVTGLKKSTLPSGHSDVAGVCPDGRAIFIEVKAPGKKPTPEQYEFIERVNKHGGIAFWADSVETVERNLDV